MEKKSFLPQKLYKKIGLTFIVLTVILVLAVVYFSLSQATINITADQEKTNIEFMARVMPAEKIADYTGATEAISGGVYTATVRGSQAFKTTAGQTGDAQATG
ncbi:MAG: hypothetical protein V1692_01665, partial [bacterium]